ncbi:afadin- and alpha-actinin-binding protein-like [Latimeria chalumnae]|uniref:afadin- and alpha-actinin-binding protein-like n=1 Tax=Latimeria chalumnae TaxID=7897 RepID=UPI00313C4735
MYKVLVGNLEKQLKELMAENSELKQLLDHMKRDMHCILASHKASVEEDSFAAALDLEEGEEDLLKEDLSQSCEAVQEQLTRTVRKQWRSLKSHVEKLGAQSKWSGVRGLLVPVSWGKRTGGPVALFLDLPWAVVQQPLPAVESEVISMTDHDKEIAKLKVEIEQSREVISMQQHLLQEHTAALNSSDLPTPLRDSYFLEEQEHLKEEWEMFEEQRKKFELERRNFTEAAIRLGYERQKFEEERALLVKQQFLSLTPFVDHKGTPTWKTMTSFTPVNSDRERQSEPLQHAKPSLTPYLCCCGSSIQMKSPLSISKTRCPKSKETSPSTAELYRVLRLAPESRPVARSCHIPERRRGGISSHLQGIPSWAQREDDFDVCSTLFNCSKDISF